MTKKFKKWALVFALTTFGVATTGIVGNNVSAAEGDTQTQTEDITNDTYREANFIIGGYSVRIPNGENDEHGYGVRFHVQMSKELYDKLPTGATTGILYYPEAKLDDNNDQTVDVLTYDHVASGAQNHDSTDEWYDITVDGKPYKESVVYSYNIPEGSFGADIAVRGYVKVDDTYYYSATSEARSISWTARAEYEDYLAGISKLNDTHIDYLKKTYLDCTVNIDGNETTVMYGEKLEAPTYAYATTIFKGYYNQANNAKWDFENDVVLGDTYLVTHNLDLTKGEIEDFAAYDSYVNAVNYSNETAAGNDQQWLASKTDDRGETRTGVGSTLNTDGDKYKNYHVRSSASSGDWWQNVGTTTTLNNENLATNQNWYYESIWVLIDVEGYVTVRFVGNSDTQMVKGGVWSEIKLYKSYLENKGWAANWYGTLGTDYTTGGYCSFYIDTSNNTLGDSVRVYFDSATLVKGVDITATAANGDSLIMPGTEVSLTADYNANGDDLNTQHFGTLTYTYTVKAPDGSDVTVTDGKFIPTVGGGYTITATTTVDGEEISSTKTIAVYAANEINGFHTYADTKDSGYKNASTINDFTWLNTWEGRQGIICIQGTGTYGNFYFDASHVYWGDKASTLTNANSSTTLNSYITETDTDGNYVNWDYLSIKLWIDVEGSVKVVSDAANTVQGRTWVEIKLERGLFADNAGAHKTIGELAGDFLESNEYLFYIEPINGEQVTVYVDSISLEKNVAAE